MSEVDRQEIARLAAAIKQRKLEAPVIFLLEAHRPVTGIAGAALACAQPLLAMLGWSHSSEKVRRFLESRDSVEALIDCLEGKTEAENPAGESRE